jgi:hypothetical protein
MLAHTPMEKPSSTGSPIFCSYSTSSPSEMSDLAGEREDALLGALGLDVGVLLARHALRDDEEAVGGAAHEGVALAQRLDAHLVEVRPAVDNGELAGLCLNVHAGQRDQFGRRRSQRRLVELEG